MNRTMAAERKSPDSMYNLTIFLAVGDEFQSFDVLTIWAWIFLQEHEEFNFMGSLRPYECAENPREGEGEVGVSMEVPATPLGT